MELDMFHDYREIIQKIDKQNNEIFSLFEKIILSIIFLFLSTGLIMIYGIFLNKILGAIFIIISVIALTIFCLLQKKKSNVLTANNRHKIKENEKHQELRELLEVYGFDYKNEADMDRLLNLLNTKHEEYNMWGKSLGIGKNIFTVIILPILTFVFTKIAEDADET